MKSFPEKLQFYIDGEPSGDPQSLTLVDAGLINHLNIRRAQINRH